MKRHFRIAALQCNFQTREQTLAMPKFWHEVGFNFEQLLHTHADMYSAIYDETRHGELMKEYLANSAANGIETIVYMNCHILGPSIADRKEEWGMRDKNGEYPLFYKTYPGCCLNSSWVDYFHRCIEGLGKFRIYGLFFDGPFYEPCFCPRCRAKFEKKFGKPLDAATEAEHSRFAYECVMEFKENLYKKVKSVNPDWQMYFNEGLFAGRAGSADFARQISTDDLIGTEGGFFFYGQPKDHPIWHCAAAAKLAEAVAGDRPTVIFFAGDHKPWGWHMHTTAETELCYLSGIGNGASIWYGLHCNPDNYATKTGDAVRKLVAFDKKYDELYQQTRSLADIAVFYSFDTAHCYRKSGTDSDLYSDTGNQNNMPGDYKQAVEGAFGVLSHLNLAYDAVTELNLADLKRYKVVLAPSLAMVKEEVKAALDAYVAAGGVVIADGEFGLYDENGRRRAQSIFADSAGFTVTGKVNDNQTFNYFDIDPEIYRPDNAFHWMPIAPWSLEIKPAAGAEVIGRANPPMPGCYFNRPGKPVDPFAVRKALGKGCYYYFAGGCFEFYFNFTHVAHREMFGALIRRYAGRDFVLANASTGVMMSVRESKDCVLVHLTNYTSATRPITASAPQRGLTLGAPQTFRTATDLVTGEVLKRNGDGVFALPELRQFAVYRLDK